MRRSLAFIVFFIVAVLAGYAQSGRTFYIDHALGNNGNAGTKASPWQSNPFMQQNSSCNSNNNVAPTYMHQAGDTFIFKGGVTWPASCFQMNITAGGSSNAIRDTYTVDQTWFTGGSFTRPIFAGQNVAMDGMIIIAASNLNLSWLDVGGWHVTTVNGNSANCDQATIMVEPTPGGYSNITASHMYLHDWLATVAPTSLGSGDPHGITSGGMCINQFSTYEGANVVLDHSEVSDAGNMVGGQEFAFGACGMQITIQYTHCHDLFEGIVQHASVHDSEFDHISYNPSGSGLAPAEAWNTSYNPSNPTHTNVIESNFEGGDGPVYNNYVHSTGTFGEVIAECFNSTVYNNVVSNVSRTGILFYACVSDNASSVASVYNNTVDQSNSYNREGFGAFATYGFSASSAVKFQNNISIGTSASISGGGGSVTTPNRQMTATEAQQYGFVLTNKYAPSSSDPNVTGQGSNLTSLCSGNLAAVCLDASGSPWFGGSYKARGSSPDLGAFQFGGGPVGPPMSSVTAPSNGATISGASVSVTASCTPQSPATCVSTQIFVDGAAFSSGGSVTLDSTKISNGSHTISAVVTDSNMQTGTASTITVTVNNSIPGCFVTNRAGATQQGFTAQTTTFTATWTETPNSTGTNDTVVGLASTPAIAYNQLSPLLRSNTSGFWDAWDNSFSGGTYHAANSAPYVGGTAYSFSGTFTFSSGNLTNYSISETSPSSIVIASGYTPRAAATSLAYLVGISDAGIYDTTKVCGFQIPPAPSLSYSPGPLNFGPVVNTMTSTLTESVSVTSGPATVASAVVAGIGFSLDGSSTCPTSGSLSSSCTYIVDFTPPSTGSWSGTLTVTSNATGSPQISNLTGTGIAPAVTFSLSQNSLNFGNVLINSTHAAGPVLITITNGPSTGSGSSFSGPNAADFALAANTWTGSVASTGVTVVSFTPSTLLPETATLTFTSGNATSTAPAVTLTGTGVKTTSNAPSLPGFFAWKGSVPGLARQISCTCLVPLSCACN